MIIVTYQEGSRCELCNDKDEAIQVVKNLMESSIMISDIVAYDVRSVGSVIVSLGEWEQSK